MWSKRLEWEFYSKKGIGCFLTLTFDDENVYVKPHMANNNRYVQKVAPNISPNVTCNKNQLTLLDTLLVPEMRPICKKDVQDFLKRFRKQVKTPITYFACGEYGEESLRPHYHLLIIGWQPSKKDLAPLGLNTNRSLTVEKCWKFGSNQVGGISQRSIRYVTGYVIKQKHMGEFRLMSKSIGKEFVTKNSPTLTELYARNKLSIPKNLIDAAGITNIHETARDIVLGNNYKENMENYYDFTKRMYSERMYRENLQIAKNSQKIRKN